MSFYKSVLEPGLTNSCITKLLDEVCLLSKVTVLSKCLNESLLGYICNWVIEESFMQDVYALFASNNISSWLNIRFALKQTGDEVNFSVGKNHYSQGIGPSLDRNFLCNYSLTYGEEYNLGSLNELTKLGDALRAGIHSNQDSINSHSDSINLQSDYTTSDEDEEFKAPSTGNVLTKHINSIEIYENELKVKAIALNNSTGSRLMVHGSQEWKSEPNFHGFSTTKYSDILRRSWIPRLSPLWPTQPDTWGPTLLCNDLKEPIKLLGSLLEHNLDLADAIGHDFLVIIPIVSDSIITGSVDGSNSQLMADTSLSDLDLLVSNLGGKAMFLDFLAPVRKNKYLESKVFQSMNKILEPSKLLKTANTESTGHSATRTQKGVKLNIFGIEVAIEQYKLTDSGRSEKTQLGARTGWISRTKSICTSISKASIINNILNKSMEGITNKNSDVSYTDIYNDFVFCNNSISSKIPIRSNSLMETLKRSEFNIFKTTLHGNTYKIKRSKSLKDISRDQKISYSINKQISSENVKNVKSLIQNFNNSNNKINIINNSKVNMSVNHLIIGNKNNKNLNNLNVVRNSYMELDNINSYGCSEKSKFINSNNSVKYIYSQTLKQKDDSNTRSENKKYLKPYSKDNLTNSNKKKSIFYYSSQNIKKKTSLKNISRTYKDLIFANNEDTILINNLDPLPSYHIRKMNLARQIISNNSIIFGVPGLRSAHNNYNEFIDWRSCKISKPRSNQILTDIHNDREKNAPYKWWDKEIDIIPDSSIDCNTVYPEHWSIKKDHYSRSTNKLAHHIIWNPSNEMNLVNDTTDYLDFANTSERNISKPKHITDSIPNLRKLTNIRNSSSANSLNYSLNRSENEYNFADSSRNESVFLTHKKESGNINERTDINDINERTDINYTNDINKRTDINDINERTDINYTNDINDINERTDINDINERTDINYTNDINERTNTNDINERTDINDINARTDINQQSNITSEIHDIAQEIQDIGLENLIQSCTTLQEVNSIIYELENNIWDPTLDKKRKSLCKSLIYNIWGARQSKDTNLLNTINIPSATESIEYSPDDIDSSDSGGKYYTHESRDCSIEIIGFTSETPLSLLKSGSTIVLPEFDKENKNTTLVFFLMASILLKKGLSAVLRSTTKKKTLLELLIPRKVNGLRPELSGFYFVKIPLRFSDELRFPDTRHLITPLEINRIRAILLSATSTTIQKAIQTLPGFDSINENLTENYIHHIFEKNLQLDPDERKELLNLVLDTEYEQIQKSSQ